MRRDLPRRRRFRYETALRLAGLVLIGTFAAWLAYRYRQVNVADVEAWIDSFGMAAPLVFILIYAVGTVLLFPATIVTLAGGALFGPVWGSFYNLNGAALGSTLAFLIARYVAGDWFERRGGRRLLQIKRGVEAEGWRFVAFVRLVPIFPFVLVNYAFGLTRIPAIVYIVTGYVCMVPTTVAYTYLGYAGREALQGGEGRLQQLFIALTFVAVLLFVPHFIRRFRASMAKAEPPAGSDEP